MSIRSNGLYRNESEIDRAGDVFHVIKFSAPIKTSDDISAVTGIKKVFFLEIFLNKYVGNVD